MYTLNDLLENIDFEFCDEDFFIAILKAFIIVMKNKNVDFINKNDNSILIAYEKNKKKILNFLIPFCKNINKKNNNGETLLNLASKNNDIDLVSLLINNKCDLDLINNK